MSNQLCLTFEPTKSDKAGQAKRTLECLRAGPKTTLELIAAVGPRPAAYVRQLRQQGWRIESTKLEKVALYRLVGKVEMVEVTKAMQEAYYETQHWNDTRLQRLHFDGWRCASCGLKHDLQCHHWKYDLFNENQVDLLTLCRECHERMHNYDNVQCHFPRFVEPWIAEKLSTN